ncbi:nucleoside triphosphate pyrophosphohydrolase [Shewanella psychrotolerans]|uniref:nucleoside triphosphate pyrophosphohydrolase n=1 Tax=Shewanella psychrotolerans TaxID=2864206 RepID=UPI001C65644F|nr:nucleoside triphosphate pyrophosphohydrolase [Shewanella psychrotolerans]QYK02368.1 nucleoside triphosphate pyrophosphohydrolase [Shewanella psychrotolerans]
MTAPKNIERLLQIMSKLRDPETGCPWDLAQNYQTIVPFTLEEAFEVADTIERNALDELPGELGDLLFQVIFYCQLGKEQGLFDFALVVDKICNKLTERHPHVFGGLSQATTQEVKQTWEGIKASERIGRSLHSVLDDIPLNLPALSRAAKIQRRVATVGFDWDELEPVVGKIHEEIEEVLVEVNAPEQDPQKVTEEMGDLLFAVVNLARHIGVDAEQALRQANIKFERRFRGVEALANVAQKPMKEHSLAELDSYWEQVKVNEKTKA